jgi:hypothetical protein
MRLLAYLAPALLLTGCPSAAPPPEAPTVPLPPAAPSPEPSASAPAPKPAPPPAPKPARPTALPGTTIRFTGGDGSSIKDAIVIEGAKGEIDGVPSEYQYLEMLIGPRRGNWKMIRQSLLNENGKKYDLLEIDHQGKTESYYFDITGYFGK